MSTCPNCGRLICSCPHQHPRPPGYACSCDYCQKRKVPVPAQGTLGDLLKKG
jgi:hypothetical protein